METTKKLNKSDLESLQGLMSKAEQLKEALAKVTISKIKTTMALVEVDTKLATVKTKIEKDYGNDLQINLATGEYSVLEKEEEDGIN